MKSASTEWIITHGRKRKLLINACEIVPKVYYSEKKCKIEYIMWYYWAKRGKTSC